MLKLFSFKTVNCIQFEQFIIFWGALKMFEIAQYPSKKGGIKNVSDNIAKDPF